MTGALAAKENKRNTARERSARSRTASQSEFIDIELTAEQGADARARYAVGTQLDDELTEMVDSGYRFTVKYDDRNSAYSVFCFPAEDSDAAGMILSGRGKTVFSALMKLAYKHHVLLQADWQTSRNFMDPTNGTDW